MGGVLIIDLDRDPDSAVGPICVIHMCGSHWQALVGYGWIGFLDDYAKGDQASQPTWGSSRARGSWSLPVFDGVRIRGSAADHAHRGRFQYPR